MASGLFNLTKQEDKISIDLFKDTFESDLKIWIICSWKIFATVLSMVNRILKEDYIELILIIEQEKLRYKLTENNNRVHILNNMKMEILERARIFYEN